MDVDARRQTTLRERATRAESSIFRRVYISGVLYRRVEL